MALSVPSSCSPVQGLYCIEHAELGNYLAPRALHCIWTRMWWVAPALEAFE